MAVAVDVAVAVAVGAAVRVEVAVGGTGVTVGAARVGAATWARRVTTTVTTMGVPVATLEAAGRPAEVRMLPAAKKTSPVTQKRTNPDLLRTSSNLNPSNRALYRIARTLAINLARPPIMAPMIVTPMARQPER